jgi:hypothetical protein
VIPVSSTAKRHCWAWVSNGRWTVRTLGNRPAIASVSSVDPLSTMTTCPAHVSRPSDRPMFAASIIGQDDGSDVGEHDALAMKKGLGWPV